MTSVRLQLPPCKEIYIPQSYKICYDLVSEESAYCFYTKVGELNFRKIIKTVATIMSDFKAKVHKMQFWLGSAPDPGGGVYSAPLDL